MLSFLKDHPFAVEAFFDRSLVLTFSVPKERIRYLIPECLALYTFHDKWAFVAVAMVQTSNLRPKGFPAFFGNDFFLIGYRVFVNYINNAGKRLRGLYILKSETDSRKMEMLGNIFTHYNYTTTDIAQSGNNNSFSIKSTESGLDIAVDTSGPEIPLPPNSPFKDWKEARRFAGPLPFTFTYDPKTRRVLMVEGVRQHWHPEPVKITSYAVSFLETIAASEIQLANAFMITGIPYYWKKGKTEQWNG
jgi:uncharacterized protein YqjF (DUF2071 family)